MMGNGQSGGKAQRAQRGPLQAHPGNLDDPGRPVAPYAVDYVGASLRPWHHHRRGQLLYADARVMPVATAAGTWVVAPEPAVVVPAGNAHQVAHRSGVALRALSHAPGVARALPAQCCVVAGAPPLGHVTPN